MKRVVLTVMLLSLLAWASADGDETIKI